MILRNKNTGEIVVCGEGIIEFKTFGCKNLGEFLEAGWEDYKPAEPLIKDEKIRKAVRSWAEANGRNSFKVINEHFNCCKIVGFTTNSLADGGSRIEFNTTIAGAKQKYFYTLAELCGEEEE